MGYRSQVAIGITKKAFEKHVDQKTKPFEDCDLIYDSEDNVTFLWEDVKWYDSYSDVQAITKVIKEALAEDETSVGMVRIGEEAGDIETLGSPWEFEISSSCTMNIGDGETIDHDKFFVPRSVKFIRGDKDD